MNRVCVYCGSRFGKHDAYKVAAQKMGELIATSGVTLVYGGASRGLMGELASSAMKHGGKVIGVIPEALVEKEIAHEALSELQVVPDMHVRKATMSTLADAFIALPGGAGTLEEFFEMFTWWQVGFHKKPIAVANIEGFYDPLISLFEKAVSEGFVEQQWVDRLLIESDLERLWAKLLANFAP
ncbi:MAG: TIGR00730 family Rossman fold protein [Myxococcales bacterium]|nr:MAG: TIGR00730 family Rossman fold protein [Myxococcales bacterium]